MISFDSNKHQKNTSENFQAPEHSDRAETVVKNESESDEDDMIFERCSQDHPDLDMY